MDEVLATQVTEPELRFSALVLKKKSCLLVCTHNPSSGEGPQWILPANLAKSVVHRLSERHWLKDINKLSYT